MTVSSPFRVARTESLRWATDLSVLVPPAVLTLLAGAVTYVAVVVASGGGSAGTGGLQIDTDTLLTGESTSAELISMALSSLSMLVPVAAIVVAVQFAGSELSSGALLQIGTSVRRVRYVFALRALILTGVVALAGAFAAAAALAASSIAIAQVPSLADLNPWEHASRTIGGAALQAIIIALAAFGLSALSRRWVIVLIGLLVYLVALEPLLASLVGDASVWLPRAATTELLVPHTDFAHIVPTLAGALALATAGVLVLRRDRLAR